MEYGIFVNFVAFLVISHLRAMENMFMLKI